VTEAVSTVATVWLAAVFAYAISFKVTDFPSVAASFEQHRTLARRMVPLGLVGLIVAEAATVALLVGEGTRALGGLAAAGLGALFAGYAWFMRRHQPATPCGCAGTASSASFDAIAVLRGALIAAAGLSTFSHPSGPDAVVLAPVAVLSALPAMLVRWRQLRPAATRHRHAHQRVVTWEPVRPDLLALLARHPGSQDARAEVQAT